MRIAILVLMLAAGAGSARAETRDVEHWYGGYVLGADAVAWTAVVVGGKYENVDVLGAGLIAMAIGGPVVHLAHGNLGNAGISLGMRIGGFGLGALAGHLALPAPRGDPFPIGIILGSLAGNLIAAAIDIIVVAKEPDEPAARVLSIGGQF